MTKKEKELWASLIKQHETTLDAVWNGDRHMIDYCLKESSAYVQLENGNYIVLEKPRIETSFCFGYRLSSYDTVEYDDANKLADNARKDVSYFMKENLRDFDNRIAELKDKYNKFGLVPHYNNEDKNNPLKSYIFIDEYHYPNRFKNKEYIEVSDNDRKTIIKALESEKEKFIKRLNTYLKRFGLSKVSSWSYWQDL